MTREEKLKKQKEIRDKTKRQKNLLRKGKRDKERPFYVALNNHCKCILGMSIEELKLLDTKSIEQQEFLEFVLDEKERKKEYYEDSNSKCLECIKEYYSFEGENRRIYSQTIRAQKKNLLATFTSEQWDFAKRFFDNNCCYCGKSKKLIHEHFIPVSKGGDYTEENILPSCHSCNSSKRNKDFFKWYCGYMYYNKEREDKILSFLKIKKSTAKKGIKKQIGVEKSIKPF